MKLEIPEAKRLLHASRMTVRWGDMDAMGHVNNTVYFRYMETARVEWLERVGGVPRALGADQPPGQGALIVNAFCNFRRQLTYPADLVVRLYGSSPGRSSFDTWFEIERLDAPGELMADGGSTTVWIDFATQRPVPIPDAVRALLA